MELNDEKLLNIRKRKLRNKRNANAIIRGPRNSMRKWKIDEERIILEYFRNVIRQNLNIEKPTAEIFYIKLIEDLNLDDVSPTQAKNKVRHLKDSYVRAVKWIQQNEQDPISSFGRQCLLEMCPHYDILSEIYGNKLNIIRCKVEPKQYFGIRIHPCVGGGGGEEREEEDSAQNYDSDNSNLPLKRSPSEYEEHPDQNSISKEEEQFDESLYCFKQFLTTTSDAINRAFPSPAPSLTSEPRRRSQPSKKHSASTTTTSAESEANSSFEDRWKMEELKLQHEKLQMEKLRQQWERDLKEKELEVRRKDIETNERLRILEIEKEERMEKFKIEQDCKLQLELANIKNAQSS